MSERGSGGGDGLSGSGSNVKTIGEVKSLQIGLNSDKGEYYSTLATTVMFQKDKAMYQSCTQSGSDGKGCNKKVCKYILKRTHIIGVVLSYVRMQINFSSISFRFKTKETAHIGAKNVMSIWTHSNGGLF